MSCRRSPRNAVACALLGVLLGAPRVHAEAAPDRVRPSSYYAAHGSAVALLFAGGLLIRSAPRDTPGPDPAWFPGDWSRRGHHSASADRMSDVLISLSLLGPAFAKLGQGADLSLANAGIVYGETLSANLVLTALVKIAVNRPRPYTYGHFANALADADGPYVSFYSGHSSTAFAAAIAGSYLFAEHATDRASRYALWGTELALATATAGLRVRAGKHYYSDVLVGALAGSAFGVLVPLAHGARYTPEAGEYAAAGAGVAAGAAFAALAPFVEEVRLKGDTAHFDWSLRPLHTDAGGVGLEAYGTFD